MKRKLEVLFIILLIVFVFLTVAFSVHSYFVSKRYNDSQVRINSISIASHNVSISSSSE